MRYAWDKTMYRLLSSPVSLVCFSFFVLVDPWWDLLSYPLMHLKLTCLLAAQHPPLEVFKKLFQPPPCMCVCGCTVQYLCVWVYRCVRTSVKLRCVCERALTLPCPWVWRMMCDKCVESALWWEPAGAGRCPCPFIFYGISFYSSALLPLYAVAYTTIAIGLWWSIGSLTLKLHKTSSPCCAQMHCDTAILWVLYLTLDKIFSILLL